VIQALIGDLSDRCRPLYGMFRGVKPSEEQEAKPRAAGT